MANYEGRNGGAAPNVSPSVSSASPVLTAAEACKWLRLDDDHEQMADAVTALNLLVRKRGLRPLRVGKARKFTLAELHRFVADQVASDTQTDSNGG